MSLRTLYDEASLWMTPSGYEDGKLFSELPTDGSGDFTFSRGSNLAATRVDVNGLIEKGRENLWLQSTDLGTSPNATTAAASITGGQSGYDGSSNAWELESLSDGFYRRLYQSATQTGVITFSIYAKSANTDSLLIYNNQNGDRAWFDLSNGSLGNLNGAIDSSIEDIGGGWYRCSISLITSTASEFWICPTNGNNVASCDLGNSILLQSAQLEVGLAATDYIETGATTAQAGILENEPRLDYSGGASCPALLLEAQRTNLIDYSEYFETYNKTRVAFVHNATASPEGLINAAEFNDTATSGTHFVQLRNGVAGGGVMSFFAKQNTHRYVQAGPSSSISKRVFFDLQDGVMATIGGSAESYYGIEDYGNGWYRCYVAFGDLESPSIFTAAGDGSSFNDNNYTGDGSGVYIYGTQVEQNVSYKTSYIPTHGSSVTRSQDTSSVTNVDFFPNGEGTAFIEFEIDEVGISGYPELFRIYNPSDATNFLYCYIFEQPAGDVKVGYRLDINNIREIESSSSIALGTNKLSVRLQRGAYTAYLNGTEIPPPQTHNDVADINMTTLRIWSQLFIADERIKQFATFSATLTDSECIALTTI